MGEKVILYRSPEWEIAKYGDFKRENYRLEVYDIQALLEYLGYECEIVEVTDEKIMVM